MCVCVYVCVCVCVFLPRARMREAGVKQWVLSVSVSSKFWADHDNEGSIHF